LDFSDWKHFCRLLHDRFDRDQKELLIRQLFHVKQTSSVADYITQFTELVDQLSAYSSNTDPMYFTMRFIDGLRPEIKAIVLVLRPPDLDTACTITMLQEEANPLPPSRVARSGDWSATKSSSATRPLLPAPAVPALPRADKPLPAATPFPDSKMAAIKSYRRAMGLCFKCNAKWSKDHQCAPKVLHAVEAFWDACPDEEEVVVEDSDTSEVTEQICLAISKAVVSGVPASRTVRLLGHVAGVPVQILVDSGSSTSFINAALLTQLPDISAVPISASVQIAGGGILQCSQLLRQVPWSVGACNFQSDFKVLPLAVFDVVVGMDWLESFSPMQVHWLHKWLAIPYKGSTHILQGLTDDIPDQLLLQVAAVPAAAVP
jgi:hypothetical protein